MWGLFVHAPQHGPHPPHPIPRPGSLSNIRLGLVIASSGISTCVSQTVESQWGSFYLLSTLWGGKPRGLGGCEDTLRAALPGMVVSGLKCS